MCRFVDELMVFVLSSVAAPINDTANGLDPGIDALYVEGRSVLTKFNRLLIRVPTTSKVLEVNSWPAAAKTKLKLIYGFRRHDRL